MPKLVFPLFLAVVLLAGCKNQVRPQDNSRAPGAPDWSTPPLPPSQDHPVPLAVQLSAQAKARPIPPPPTIDAGLTVDEAYAAISHRRTIWSEANSVIPDLEKPYLSAILQVEDQAIALRVAGLQNYAKQDFDSHNLDAAYGRLIDYAKSMPVPPDLSAYHNDILQALTSQRQFFADWNKQRADFPYAEQIADHASVQEACSADRAAYKELTSRYPQERLVNQRAFYDYHSALDFSWQNPE